MNGEDTKHVFLHRNQIEQKARDLVQSVPDLGPIISAFDLAARLRINVHYDDFSGTDISGMLIRHGLHAEIRVKKGDGRQRQNFTIAHELGHFSLHPNRDWSDTRHTMFRRTSWRESSSVSRAEYQANLFAASLLMPEKAIRDRWHLLRSPDMVAPVFGVSRQAVVRRLEELNLIVRSVEGFLYVDLKLYFPKLSGIEPTTCPSLAAYSVASRSRKS